MASYSFGLDSLGAERARFAEPTDEIGADVALVPYSRSLALTHLSRPILLVEHVTGERMPQAAEFEFTVQWAFGRVVVAVIAWLVLLLYPLPEAHA